MSEPCRVAILGAPTDINSSFLRGPAQAPVAIRRALASDHANSASELGPELGAGIVVEDLGDLPLDETDADHPRIRDAVRDACARGSTPITLGGDHAVSFPAVEGVAAIHGPVNILHFDAHPDLYDDFDGNPRSHASPFARILERGLAKRLVQVGIRTLNAHQRAQVARFGVEVVPMTLFEASNAPVLEGPLYVSIDIDGLDPAFAPGVSHPEPGGLSVRQLLDVLHRQRAPLVGADVVELNPDRDIHDLTAVVAAKLVRELAGYAAVRGR
jgi:agmatinase